MRRPTARQGRETAAPAGEALDGVGEDLVGPLPVGAVVVGEQGEPERRRVHALAAQGGDEDEIALDLDIFAVETDHAYVDVRLGERVLAGQRLGVRCAHLVVREDEVGAAALDVEAHAEVVQRDGHTLDVPARAAFAQEAPSQLSSPGRAAVKHQVQRVLLAGALGVAAALGGEQAHRRRVEPGDLAEVRVGVDGEVDVAFEVVGGSASRSRSTSGTMPGMASTAPM